mgnify:CR=1 FL=1
MELANNLDIQTDIKCHHCQGDIVSVVKNDEEQSFCCRGCLSVHGILQNFGLSNYYELTQAESKLIPQAIEVEGYDYPYGYVRWTENRNMQEVLRLLSDKKINSCGADRLLFAVLKSTLDGFTSAL